MNAPALDEHALRLRALVRVVVSPGIWLIVGLQLLIQLLGRMGQPAQDDPTAAMAATFFGAAVVLALLFVQAGVFSSLARSRTPVALGDVLRGGRESFFPFVWLIVRAALLLAGVGLLAGMIVLALMGTNDPQQLAAALAPYVVAGAVLLPFLFVYWLPLVFVHGDFRLLVTLRGALSLFWQRRAQGWFVALLILVPAIVVGLLPSATPFAARVVLGAAIMLLAWSAYTYCIEVLVARRDGTSTPPVS